MPHSQDKSVGSVTVAGYHYESDALSSCSDTESEFYAGREHIWDFSMYGFENPFEDPPDDESETVSYPSRCRSIISLTCS